MSEKAPKTKKGKKDTKRKGKKGAAAAGAAAADGRVTMSVSGHPRAQARIRQAKGWGGLSAFGATAYLSLAHGVGPDVAGARALGAGMAGYVVAWGCSVMVWRQLMVAELRARVDRARRQLEAELDAASAEGEPPAMVGA